MNRLREVASADAGVGWCRACGVERESVELDARGCACGSCGAPAVDGGVQIWMLDRVRQSHPALREQQLLLIGAALERLQQEIDPLPGRRDRKPHRRRLADHHRI